MFYFMEAVEDEAIGVGHTSDAYYFDMLREGMYYEHWEPVSFRLRDGGPADYQPNDLGWPLCSLKLKSVIEVGAVPHDRIQWLDAKLVGDDGKEHPYYILHLPYRLHVLDKEKTIWDDIFVDTPVLDLRVVKDHRVFSYPGGFFSVIVADEVKTAIQMANCTAGMEFWPIADNQMEPT